MKRQIIVKNSGFVQYISTPLVAGDVQAYEIILNAGQDITGCSFTVTATRADGVKVSGAGTVSGDTAKYTLENNMHSIPGVLIARLTLMDQLGSVLTDHELHFDVVEGNGDPDLSGDDRVPALNQIILNATAAASNAATAAEFAQTQGENAQAKAAYANEQGDYAKEQGDYAKSKGDDFPIPAITNDGDVLTVGKRQSGDEPNVGLTYVNIGSTTLTYRLVANYSNFDLPVTENSLAGLRMTATLHLQDFGTFDVDGIIQANEMRDNNQTVIVVEKPADKPSTKMGDSFENLVVYTPKYVPAPEWKPIADNAPSTYDIVIDSQEKWDAMVAHETWNGVKSIFISCPITSNAESCYIPSNVKVIHSNFVPIKFTNPNFSKFGRSSASVAAMDIRNIAVNTSASQNGIAFYQLSNLYNCTAISLNIGFQNCSNLQYCICNCYTAKPVVAGYLSCSNLVNCNGVIDGTDALYSTCTNLVGCSAMIYDTAGNIVYKNCNTLSNCGASMGSYTTLWSGTTTKRDDDSCQLE